MNERGAPSITALPVNHLEGISSSGKGVKRRERTMMDAPFRIFQISKDN